MQHVPHDETADCKHFLRSMVSSYLALNFHAQFTSAFGSYLGQ